MTYIVAERYDRIVNQLSPAAWARIKAVARQTDRSVSATILENPDLIPMGQRFRMKGCFVETELECLRERLKELRRIERAVEKRIKDLRAAGPLTDSPPEV